MRRVTHPVQGFLAALAAVAVLSIMDAVMKHLVLALGLLTVSMWRALANLVLTSALYLPRRHAWPARRTLWIHIGRGVVVTVMAALFFWGIARVPLAQALALTFIAPLIAMLLAPLFLKERLNARLIGGGIAAFAGVVVIVLGQARSRVEPDVLLGIAAIIGSAICYSGNILMMRWQALAAKPLEINFFGFIWASICGWVAFHERVSLYTLAGALLIVGGCLLGARGKNPEPPEMDYS